MSEQGQHKKPSDPATPGAGPAGPVRQPLEKPAVDELLKRMRKVDPEQARRYRQRTGQ